LTSNRSYRGLCKKWGFQHYHLNSDPCPRLHFCYQDLDKFAHVSEIIARVIKRYALNSYFKMNNESIKYSYGFGPTSLSPSSMFVARPDFIISNGLPKRLEINGHLRKPACFRITARQRSDRRFYRLLFFRG